MNRIKKFEQLFESFDGEAMYHSGAVSGTYARMMDYNNQHPAIELEEDNIDTKKVIYSDVISNLKIVNDKILVSKLLDLSHRNISGGIKAVWKYPNENISDVVIAYYNNSPVGVITSTNGEINIFIKPKFRGIGIGKQMKFILNSNI